MSPVTIKRLLIPIATVLASTAPVCAQGDEAVDTFLVDAGLETLRETHLFERIRRAEDIVDRVVLAADLADIYLANLARPGLSIEQREALLEKGRVLITLVPKDELLALRAEILASDFAVHENAAALERLGLISDADREAAINALRVLDIELADLIRAADREETQLRAAVSRSPTTVDQATNDALNTARSTLSRARFIRAWSGYALGVLDHATIPDQILVRFGWILGMAGDLPTLDRVNRDMLELEHVARSAIGVAMVHLHNDKPSQAKVWLRAITGSSKVKESVQEIASKSLLDAIAAERDWVTLRIELDNPAAPEIDAPTARLIIISAMDALGSSNTGQGGAEGAKEIARRMVDILIDNGHFQHVVDLAQTYGELPIPGSGFVGNYSEGLVLLNRAEEENDPELFAKAAGSFGLAMAAKDKAAFGQSVDDAAIKLGWSALQANEPELARSSLEANLPGIEDESSREHATWILILATDAVIEQTGDPILEDRLTLVVEQYIERYKGSQRATMLLIRYALTGRIDPSKAAQSLIVEDPADELAIRARRQLVILIGQHPELADLEGVGSPVRHARWIWANQPDDPESTQEARARFSVCRVVLDEAMHRETPDTDTTRDTLDRAHRLIDNETTLSVYAPELAYREVQLAAMLGELDRAVTLLESPELRRDPSLMSAAAAILFNSAWTRFGSSTETTAANALVRSGLILSPDTEQTGAMTDRDAVVLERTAIGADHLARTNNDETMGGLSLQLLLRVYEHGDMGREALVLAAERTQEAGDLETSLACWLDLVRAVPDTDPLWARARYESLSLLKRIDTARFRAVLTQYRALYPEGLGEPYGPMIDALATQGGGP